MQCYGGRLHGGEDAKAQLGGADRPVDGPARVWHECEISRRLRERGLIW